MSNENNQIIEDVEEKDLVVESEVEVSEETEVTEQEQPLSDAVLDTLLGEAKKKNEEEDSDEEDSDEEDSDEEDSDEEDSEEEEEEMEESAEDPESEEEEEMEESAEEEEDSEEEAEVELPEVKTKAGILAASFDAIKGMKKSNLVAAYEAINMSEEEGSVEVPKTKGDIINAMYGQLKAMKKEDLQASYTAITNSLNSVQEETEADNFAEDLKVLAETDQELTEDFKAKASILFEAAVSNKVNMIQESLETQYSEDLQEEVAYVRESLVEKIDDYLSYVVESWIEENKEFVDNKLRVEITENFMSALQGVFTEHYVEVPDSKVDLVDELSEQVTEIQESLTTAETENVELARQVETLQREKILSEASSDLASTQAGKLASLVEETQFVDAEAFANKVATIKEGFFKSSDTSEILSENVSSVNSETKTIIEGAVDPMTKLPGDMSKYVQHLSRFK